MEKSKWQKVAIPNVSLFFVYIEFNDISLKNFEKSGKFGVGIHGNTPEILYPLKILHWKKIIWNFNIMVYNITHREYTTGLKIVF